MYSPISPKEQSNYLLSHEPTATGPEQRLQMQMIDAGMGQKAVEDEHQVGGFQQQKQLQSPPKGGGVQLLGQAFAGSRHQQSVARGEWADVDNQQTTTIVSSGGWTEREKALENPKFSCGFLIWLDY
jgi:hypothetical protein